MANDPQGYPVQEYTNLQGDVVFQVLSNGTLVFDSGILITSGNGSPNGVIEAPVGSLYIQKDGTPPDVWWQKQTGTGDTGWVLASGGGSTPPGGNDGNVQFNGMGAFNGTDNFNYVEGNGVSLQQLYRGITVSAEQDVTSAINSTIAGIFDASIDNTDPLVMIDVIGASGRATVSNSGNPSTATHCYALEAILQAGAGAVINQFAGLNISTSVVDPAATITDAYGIHISDFSIITASGESRAIKVDGGISEFQDVLAQDISQINTTAATNVANQPSPVLLQQGNYWDGAASHTDSFTIEDVLTGTGTAAKASLTIIHAGAPGDIFAKNAVSLVGSVSAGLVYETHNSFSQGADFYTHSATAGLGATLALYRSRGTQGSPSAVTVGDSLGFCSFGGWSGSFYIVGANIQAKSTDNWTGSGPYGTQVVFNIDVTGTTNLVEAFRAQSVGSGVPSLRIPATATLSFFTGASDSDVGFSRINAGVLGLGNGTATGNTSGNLQLNQITKYNNETTAGPGVSYIRGVTSQKNETGADANVLTVTPPAAVGSYRLRVVLSVSAATSATIGWTATWTDSNGTAQTPTNLSLFQSGVAAPALTFTTSAAGNYYGEAQIDTNNGGANIVIKTTFTGTSVAYKITATIERIV